MIRRDYKAFHMSVKDLIIGFFTANPFYAVLLYRMGNFFSRRHIPVIPGIFQGLSILFFSCEISPHAKIGGGFRIYHTVGIVIGPECVIGDNFSLYQNVTLGSGKMSSDGRVMPRLGNDVTVYAGAALFGGIDIGNNVSVGANSVVNKSFADNAVIAGVPAKVISQ